ncbi:MAG: ammonium transporter [Gemmataceae bacterium]
MRHVSWLSLLLAFLCLVPTTWAQPPEPKKEKSVEERLKDAEKTIEELNKTASDLATYKGDSKVAADTLWVMITGMLVFFMNLGFACVESGFCRAKNCVNILSKNFIVFAATTIGFWAVGWGLMFSNGNEWIGKDHIFMVKGPDNSPATSIPGFEGQLKADVKEALGIDLGNEGEAKANEKVVAAVEGYVKTFNETTSNKVKAKEKDEKGKEVEKEVDNKVAVKIEAGGKTLEKDYMTKDFYWGAYGGLSWPGVPLWAKFFFQLVFAGTAATIVSGAVAERIKYHSFILFSFIMAIAIYPVVGHWVWGGGILQTKGFVDFAGSTQVHSIGGWAALIAVIVLGPRIGKFGPNGKINAIPGHNITAATIGCFVLWFGWFGFNPGSTMAADPSAITEVAITTNLAACAATLTATVTAWIILGKPDIGMTLNGCLAGLVAITAPCAFVTAEVSILIGAIAGVVVVLAVMMFDRLRIDDPVGATSVHLVNGVFGTICVGLFSTPDRLARAGNAAFKPGLFYGGGMDQLMVQLQGVVYTAVYVMALSLVAWLVLKYTVGIRVSAEEETEGLDIGEHGNEAYFGFTMAREGTGTGVEPKAALLPPNAQKRFTVVLDGMPTEKIAAVWSELCQPKNKPNKEFLEVYPKMTSLVGNRFGFIDGDPSKVGTSLAKLFSKEGAVKATIEK